MDHTNIITPATAPNDQVTLNSGSPGCTPNYATLPPNTTTYGGYVLCAGEYDFLPGSSHTIGAPAPQQDTQNNWWVFSQFSNGLGQNSTYVADDNTGQAATVTADFIPGMQSAIVTIPAGMKIVIDGTSAWAGYNFVWGDGTQHTLSAPATQVDSSGRTWQFVSWSNGGAASQTVTVPASGVAFSVTATYTELGQVQVITAPSGLTFSVGGSNCTTPCSVSQVSGSQIQIVAPAAVPQTSTQQLSFASWSSGGSSTPTLQATFTQGIQTFTATYQTEYLLTVASSPANAATVKTSPASTNGFYPAGTPDQPDAGAGFRLQISGMGRRSVGYGHARASDHERASQRPGIRSGDAGDCAGRHHECRRADAGRLGCSGLHHFHLRPESGLHHRRWVPPILWRRQSPTSRWS